MGSIEAKQAIGYFKENMNIELKTDFVKNPKSNDLIIKVKIEIDDEVVCKDKTRIFIQ